MPSPYSLQDPTVNGSTLSGQQVGQVQVGIRNNLSGTNPTGSLSSTDVTAGGLRPLGSVGKNLGFFEDPNKMNLALGGLQILGSLWNSFQQNKIAKEELALQREAYQTNLANNRQTYNTALEDRIRARYHTEGRPGQANAYLEKHSL